MLSLLCFTVTSLAQTAPDTDIWVYSLKERKAKMSISEEQRVTDRKGYDNQPSFYQNDFLLYTSQIEGQTDIIVKDLFEGDHMNLTHSAESEYSAQVVPGFSTFGTVRVSKEGKQQLWIHHMDGETPPQLVMNDIEPVGYFAWNSKNNVLSFVLGDPVTLVKANVNEPGAKVITSNVGRSIKLIPGTDNFAFERREENGDVTIYRLFDKDNSFEKVIIKPENAMDWCISSKGSYITSVGSKLYKFNPKYDDGWIEFADLGEKGSRGITRMAVNENNQRIALVINN